MKALIAIVTGIIGLVYLLNPGAGVIELIFDNVPLIGNIDEAIATGLLLNSLAYFGINLVPCAKRKKRKDEEE